MKQPFAPQAMLAQNGDRSSIVGQILRCLAMLALITAGMTSVHAQEKSSPVARQETAQATVKILSGADVCSGVFITPAGHLLTVAHGIHPEAGPVRIIFGQGEPEDVSVLIHDGAQDIALLRRSDASVKARPHRFVSVDLNAAIAPTDPVLACGFPARESSLTNGLLRTGTVVALDDQNLRTTCMLTVGDSGGPLLNARGRLIGLHRQIGVGPQANLHIPVRRAFQSIRNVVSEDEVTGLLQAAPVIELLPQQTDLATDIHQRIIERTVRISVEQLSSEAQILQVERRRTAVHGFLLTEKTVATKLSELDPGQPIHVAPVQSRTPPDPPITATVRASDRALDLAILELDRALPITSASLPISMETPKPGDLVVAFSSTSHRTIVNGTEKTTAIGSAGSTKQTLRTITGIVGRTGFDEPRMKPRLGIVLDETRTVGALVIQRVLPSSAAAEAGLNMDDVLIKAGDTELTSPLMLGTILEGYQPGDWLSLQIRPAGSPESVEPVTKTLKLKGDPSNQFEKTEFLDGRAGSMNDRRTGFAQVIQVDCPVEPEDCGTVVINRTGELIGLTIARRSREATLVLPMPRVMEYTDRIK